MTITLNQPNDEQELKTFLVFLRESRKFHQSMAEASGDDSVLAGMHRQEAENCTGYIETFEAVLRLRALEQIDRGNEGGVLWPN